LALAATGVPRQAKKARFESLEPSAVSTLPEEEYRGHVNELKKEWARPKPNKQHIMVLLRDTFPNRRA